MDRRKFIALTGAAAAAAAIRPARAAQALTEDEIKARVAQILPKLSLEQKVGIMSGYKKFMPPLITPHEKLITNDKTHGLPEHGIPGLYFLDGPAETNFDGSTCFPQTIARGASWDPGLNERVSEAIGYEVRAHGANCWGGLVVNLIRHPSGGRSQETFGEEPHHVGAMGAAAVRGSQRHVMACVKHYACNNNEDTRFSVNVRIGERTLRELYLPHFKACVDAGAGVVMSAFNDLNGELCGHNRHLLRDILKGDWSFKGFVISDFGDGVEATVPAALAGLDIEMPVTEWYGPKLVKAVRDGQVPMAVIDEAAGRIIGGQLRFLHLAVPLDMSRVSGAEHVALAREAARKGIVLLKNAGGLLPLDPRGLKKLAVLGRLAAEPNLGRNASSTPSHFATPLDGLRARLPGVELAYEEGRVEAAVRRACSGADAVFVVAGCTKADEGEGGFGGVGDRRDLGLHKSEIDLIRVAAEANKKVIVALMGGSAITLTGWGDAAQSILMTWYPGMEGGHALAEILVGDCNPSGRLPMTWPKDVSQCVPFNRMAPALDYDLYHGYRLCDRDGTTPEFPFGYGLSYTTFRHANLAADPAVAPDGTLAVSLDVTNTGAVAGEETVQVYVGCKGSAAPRVKKELKAFTKVALGPGETKRVTLTVPAIDLAYFDEKEKRWKVETAEYVAYAGSSANEVDLLKADFVVR